MNERQHLDEANIHRERRKAGNRALLALILGVVLFPVAAILVLATCGCLIGCAQTGCYGGPQQCDVYMIAGSIVGLMCILSFLASLMFYLRYAELKGRIKKLEHGEADEPKYPGF